MHGGVKVYRGAAGPARTYVEADRSRADDYYLAEGTGVARRYAATGIGPVVELLALDGDAYETWVAASTRRRGSRGGGYGPTSTRCGSWRWW